MQASRGLRVYGRVAQVPSIVEAYRVLRRIRRVELAMTRIVDFADQSNLVMKVYSTTTSSWWPPWEIHGRGGAASTLPSW
jgi:hypothetical protein